MTTSIPANASSPANISPVGPPPAITTACLVIDTSRPDIAATTHASRSSQFRRHRLAAGDYAARPGACGKPPSVGYIECGEERIVLAKRAARFLRRRQVGGILT